VLPIGGVKEKVLALLQKDAAEQKTTDRAGRESHPLPEPEPASHDHVPVGQA
jgi:ATP-dependent Lon protease